MYSTTISLHTDLYYCKLTCLEIRSVTLGLLTDRQGADLIRGKNTKWRVFISCHFFVMSYRKIYCKELWISRISKSFDIHHIDHNRKNNDIENLVALPQTLHIKYHKLYPQNEYLQYKLPKWVFWHWLLSHTIEEANKFLEVYEECLIWLHYRNHFLFWFPNLYNLSYK